MFPVILAKIVGVYGSTVVLPASAVSTKAVQYTGTLEVLPISVVRCLTNVDPARNSDKGSRGPARVSECAA